MVQERENQYAIDLLKALATETIKKLWVIIILLIVLLFGTSAAWVIYESQFLDVEVTQDVEQGAEGSGTNNFIGGDYFGSAESENESEIQG